MIIQFYINSIYASRSKLYVDSIADTAIFNDLGRGLYKINTYRHIVT